MAAKTTKEYEIVEFKTPQDFSKWLKKNHATADGVWARLYKKDTGIPSMNAQQGIDEVLCYGWIDGQSKSYDEKSWLQKYTPRRARSMWSKRNRENVGRLIKEGRMQPAGLAEIERAKQDGRWDAAYDSPATMTIPEDFKKAVEKSKKAQATFDTLSKSSLYAIAWRLQTAKKPETRERRFKVLLEMLEKGEKIL